MSARNTKLIYLTGFMGSGKSTIAPILANTLGYSFLDSDNEIQKISGKQVSEIFLEDGESVFRERERQLLQRVSQQKNCVISLGGGTIANDTNLAIVKSTGVLVYLKLEAESVFHRMKNKTDRPLLRTKDGGTMNEEELRRHIAALFAAREWYYKQADIVVATDENTVGQSVDDIMRSLRNLSSVV